MKEQLKKIDKLIEELSAELFSACGFEKYDGKYDKLTKILMGD